jgi:PTH1 family peptidyl-tRNA hydrolase
VRLILGIGNPGRRYSFNRHNVGFMFLDYMAAKESISFFPSKGDYFYAEGKINNSEYSLIKPSTYVNDSGRAALQALQFNNAKVEDLLVIVDDLNLNFSDFRVRASGGDGGHNGVASIIYNLSSDKFPRIRIGINNNSEKDDMVDFVLADFNNEEKESLKNIFEDCFVLTRGFIEGGIKTMMDLNSTLKISSNKDKGNREKI